MAVNPRLDDFQRRHAWLGMPIAVFYKFADDQGPFLTALMTYYGFLSLFALMLLAATILGFVLHGNSQLQHRIIGSALVQFPIIGKQIQTNLHGYTGSTAGLAVGIAGSIYGSLGVVQAAQNTMNVVWAVPRNQRPNPLKSRLRSLVLIGTLGGGVLLATALSGLITGANSYSTNIHIGIFARVLAIVLSLATNLGLFLVGFRVLTAKEISTRDVAPGACAAAIAWELLQLIGTYYLAHKLKGSRELYGVFALVLGLLAWIYLQALVVVLCAELNAVVRQRLWPRALLTPFTDDVNLTAADRQAYGSYAKAQRMKGFERVDVEFDEHPTRPTQE